MRALPILLTFVVIIASASTNERADPASDAPEPGARAAVAFKDAGSYAEALNTWRSPEDVNAWIGARFRYDMARAMALSETQRREDGRLPIRAPTDFFADPTGVCVDLSRFAVETLRRIAPADDASYLMIEFAPVTIAGNTLRLHWVASFKRNGHWYFFADSKRPGHIAGPYASVQQFVDEYAAYRRRQIVAFRELGSYERKPRVVAIKQQRDGAPGPHP